jgi:hypothetical protein
MNEARTRLWAIPEIGMVGRRRIFENRIKPALLSQGGFVLKGEPGVGITAMLEACQDLYTGQGRGKIALVSGKEPVAKIMKKIVADWQIEVETDKKPTVAQMERAILQESGNLLLVDDMQRLTPRVLDFVTAVSQYHRICGGLRITRRAMKEELRQLLWSMEEFRLPRLGREEAVTLSRKMCQHFGQSVSFQDVANASSGLPGRIYASAKAGKVIRHDVRMQAEEIDLSPVLFFGLCCLVIFRYLGRATDATDFVLIGGASIVFMILGRNLMSSGKEK